jgi:hypothetical protein
MTTVLGNLDESDGDWLRQLNEAAAAAASGGEASSEELAAGRTTAKASSQPALTIGPSYVDDHGGWSYTTFIADAPETFWPSFDGETPEESAGWGWFTPEEMRHIKLHPGFKASLPKLLAGIAAKSASRGIIFKVGPEGYIHGWIKVGPGEEPPLTEDAAFNHVKELDQRREMSDPEARALMQYGSPSGYKVVNPYLHHHGQVYDSNMAGYRDASPREEALAKSMIKGMDEAFHNATPLEHGIITSRRTGNIDDMLGEPGSMVGKVFHSKAYTSTTTVPDARTGYGFGYESKPGRLEIHVPSGSKVLRGNDFEHEVILPRDASFRVMQDTLNSDGTRSIGLEYEPNE